MLKLTPSSDTRLRAAEIPFRYTLGREQIIRIDGFPGAQKAFHLIRQRIRGNLIADVAEVVIKDIELALRAI